MSSIGSQSSGSHVGGGATPTSARSEIGFGGNNTQPPTEASRPRTQKEEDEEAFKELVRFPVLPREYQLFLGHTSISNHLGKNEYFQFFFANPVHRSVHITGQYDKKVCKFYNKNSNFFKYWVSTNIFLLLFALHSTLCRAQIKNVPVNASYRKKSFKKFWFFYFIFSVRKNLINACIL